jgi:hypothetical protein
LGRDWALDGRVKGWFPHIAELEKGGGADVNMGYSLSDYSNCCGSLGVYRDCWYCGVDCEGIIFYLFNPLCVVSHIWQKSAFGLIVAIER